MDTESFSMYLYFQPLDNVHNFKLKQVTFYVRVYFGTNLEFMHILQTRTTVWDYPFIFCVRLENFMYKVHLSLCMIIFLSNLTALY